MKFSVGVLFIVLLVFPVISAYSIEEYESVNASIISVEESIEKVDLLVSNYTILASDLEVSLRLSEAKLKQNISISYLLAAQEANATNPELGVSYLNFASTSAIEAKSLADSALIIANAKILSAETQEAQIKEKIEAISDDLTGFREKSEKFELDLSSISKEIEELKGSGLSLTTAGERLQEARILFENSIVKFNSSQEAFNLANYGQAQTDIDDALDKLEEANIKADSANSLMVLARKEISSQVEDVEAFLNETGGLLEYSSNEFDIAANGLLLVESFGISGDEFRLVHDSNAVHLNSAREYFEKAVFRKNLQDFSQAKEFSLLAMEELNFLEGRQQEFFDSILVVAQPGIQDGINITVTSLQKEEARYSKNGQLDNSYKKSAEEMLSKTKISVAEARHSKILAERKWDNGDVYGALMKYIDASSSLEEANSTLSELRLILGTIEEKQKLENNIIMVENLSRSSFSGIGINDLNEIQSEYDIALGDLETNNYTGALEKIIAANERADQLIKTSQKRKISLQRGGLLVAFSIFLFGGLIIFELYLRLKG